MIIPELEAHLIDHESEAQLIVPRLEAQLIVIPLVLGRLPQSEDRSGRYLVKARHSLKVRGLVGLWGYTPFEIS